MDVSYLTEYQWQALLFVFVISLLTFLVIFISNKTLSLRSAIYGMAVGLSIALVGLFASCVLSGTACRDIFLFKEISSTFGFIRTYQGGLGIFIGCFFSLLNDLVRTMIRGAR